MLSKLRLPAPRLIAFIAGLVSATGFQPLNLWPLTLIAVAIIMLLVSRATGWRSAAMLGWLFGVGHFIMGNNWIAMAFTYQAKMPGWLGWVAVVLLAFYLAVYPALAMAGSWLIGRWLNGDRPDDGQGFAPSASLIAGFAACWVLSEWLRSWAFSGFSWNPLSAILLDRGAGIVLPVMGSYAASGLVWIGAGLVLLALAKNGRALAVLAGAMAILLAGGMYHSDLVALSGPKTPTPAITVVQPLILQDELNDPNQYEAQFSRLARLSQPLISDKGKPRLIFWPESGLPDYLEDGYPPSYYHDTTFAGDPEAARLRIARVIGPKAILMTGAVDLEIEKRRAVGARNSVTMIDDTGNIRGTYAKAHLVPYGEYLPMRDWLEPIGLSRLVAGSLEFWPGPGPQSVDVPGFGLKAGMQICYEIIFSGQVVDAANRPDFLFNPSNDGWFGAFGPPQHLAQARMRAIEEGLPVIRSTTTGISAIVAADGTVLARLDRGVEGRIDRTLPRPFAPTLFAQTGNTLTLIWAALVLALITAGKLSNLAKARRQR